MADRTKTFLSIFLLAAGLAPGVVHAHGRPPLIGDLRFHPDDGDFLVARATWGLVLSQDGGASWRWICADVSGTEPTREDPAILVMPDGAILVGTFDGLVRSSADRCAFEDQPIPDQWAIDLDARPSAPQTVWAAVTSGVDADVLYRSDDAGRTFAPVGDPIEDVLLERVRVAPSDPMVIYLSGFIASAPIPDAGMPPDGGTPLSRREAWVLRSTDGGETFARTRIELEDGERNLHLYAVDPSDPMRLLARVTRRITDDRPERLILSEDGGETFVTAMTARELSDAAFSADGSRAWVSSRELDGLFASDDGGRTFTQVVPGSFPCVEVRDGAVWVCVDELRDGYALGRSDDGGASIDEVLRFSMIHTLPDCPVCSEVAYVCPAWLPDLAYDLRLDAGTAAPDGGVTGAPRDAAPPAMCVDGAVVDGGIGMDGGVDGGGGGCGCRVAGRRGASWWWFVLVGLLISRARARARARARGCGR